MKDKMLAFLAVRNHCTISTVNAAGKPQSAFVAFSSDGLELFIGTSYKTRKFKNLSANPDVSIVIADQEGEVQLEGQATVLDPQATTEAQKRHLAKIPGSAKYRQDPDQRYISIKPTWIRFTEHGEPDQIEEFTEF